MEKEERTTENKMGKRMPKRHEKLWTEMDRATYSREIISHISDHICDGEKLGKGRRYQ